MTVINIHSWVSIAVTNVHSWVAMAVTNINSGVSMSDHSGVSMILITVGFQ